MHQTTRKPWHRHPLTIVFSALALFVAGCAEESLKSGYAGDACGTMYQPVDPGGGGIVLPPDTPDQTTAVTDAATLSAAISFDQAVRKTGNIPTPGAETAPALTIDPTSIRITDNSQVVFNVRPASVVPGSYIGAVFFQFNGISEHFVAVIGENDLAETLATETAAASAARAAADASPNDSQLESTALGLEAQATNTQALLTAGGARVTLIGPQPAAGVTALIQGAAGSSFAANATVQAFWAPTGVQLDFTGATWTGSTDASLWSPATALTANAVAVGSGEFQATLTWNRGIGNGVDGAVDIDLHVIEPSGNEIYYAAPTSPTGGELDVDNVTAFGPENIFYDGVVPPEGLYQVDVHYFSGAPETAWTVTVRACNMSRTYNGVFTESGQRATVVRFNLAPGCTLEDVSSVLQLPTPSIWEQALLCTEDIATVRNQ